MQRILTGDNTSGKLHLGHYVGSLENRVKLQNEYETFIILADMHALAYPKLIENTDIVSDSVLEVMLDNISVGLDPEKAAFFNESAIPEIYGIAAFLSMLTSHNRALRNPTLKEEIKDKDLGDQYSVGFVNFPIFMAADILCVGANLVPIGEDQLPHLELTRELARKFNSKFDKEVLVEPEPLVGKVRRLIGLDGNAKMTKTLGNAIFLTDDSETVKKKVMSAYTDPNRLKATDPGTVEGNPVFIYHDAFNTNESEVEDLKTRYRAGTVGDVEVKEKLYIALENFLEPIRQRRAKYEKDLDALKDILHEGNKKTQVEAKKTLDAMREAMKLKF